MQWVYKEFGFEASHRLTFHKGLCKNIHGHSYKVRVGIEGSLDENGMVLDFKELKALKQWIDDHWDHAYIHGPTDEVGLYLRSNEYRTFLMDCEPTAENMARFLAIKACRLFSYPSTVEIAVWETGTSFATACLLGSHQKTEDVCAPV